MSLSASMNGPPSLPPKHIRQSIYIYIHIYICMTWGGSIFIVGPKKEGGGSGRLGVLGKVQSSGFQNADFVFCSWKSSL